MKFCGSLNKKKWFKWEFTEKTQSFPQNMLNVGNTAQRRPIS